MESLLVFAVTSSLLITLSIQRQYKKRAQLRARVALKKISEQSDMGRCFGVDIGGTLAKLVYFEQNRNTTFMRRPRSSSYDLASDELRNFIIQRTQYGRTGIRETNLSFSCPILGGVRIYCSCTIFSFHHLLNGMLAEL